MEERSGDLGDLGLLRHSVLPPRLAPAPSSAPPTRVSSPRLVTPVRSSTANSRFGGQVVKELEVAPKQMDDVARRRLRRWIVAFAVVEFDLDLGPVSGLSRFRDCDRC